MPRSGGRATCWESCDRSSTSTDHDHTYGHLASVEVNGVLLLIRQAIHHGGDQRLEMAEVGACRSRAVVVRTIELELAGQTVELPIGANQLAKVTAGADGAVCVSLNGSNPECSSPDRGFHFATSADITVIVVGAEVHVAFLAVSAECSSAPLMGMTVHVWRCTGLDTARARIRVLDPTQILIAVRRLRRVAS